ncbi:MAG: hypothetical protein LC667_12915 [Thioalkalivibrio sp.]|nr:hypothetical protein [Thioalkalivibrio sp.]
MKLLKNRWFLLTLEAAAAGAAVGLFFKYTAAGQWLDQRLDAALPAWVPWVLLALLWLVLGLGVYRQYRKSKVNS